MSLSRSEPNNRFRPPIWALWGIVCSWLAVYLLLFFSLPSVVGITNAQGEPVPRIVDLMQILLLDQLLESMAGNGRFELGVLDRVPILVGMAIWLSLAAWIGRPLVMHSGPPPQPTPSGQRSSLTWLEQVALSMLIGLAILSTMTLLIGLAGGLATRVPMLLGVSALLAWAGFASRGAPRRIAQGNLTSTSQPAESPQRTFRANKVVKETEPAIATPRSTLSVWLMRLVPVGTCLLAVLLLYGCLMPPWEFDVVEYHLQAPKEYFQAGQIRFNSHNIYANMPLAAEMHSLAAMTIIGGPDGWWLGGLIGKGVTGCISLLAAMLLGGFLSRSFGSWCGWVAAGMLLATPGNSHVAMAGLIDMVLAAYLLAAVIVLTELWPKLLYGSVTFRELFVICVLAGSAAACKYTGLVFITAPIFVALSMGLLKARNRHAWQSFLLAGPLGLLLTCVPWYAKNFVWTGNPVFPLATSLFGSGGLSTSQVERWQMAHRVHDAASYGAYSFRALWESIQQVFLLSTFLNPALTVLFACGIAVTWPIMRGLDWNKLPGQIAPVRWFRGWILFALWIGLVWWWGTHRIDRFGLPALPLVCALAAIGAVWIGRQLSMTLAAGIVLLGLIYGGFITISGAIGDNRFFVSLRALREDAGDDQFAGRLTPAIGWANHALSESDDVRLLLIGEARAYDFRMPIVYSTCFDRSLAEEWLKEQSPQQQNANLQQAGITHIMVNWRELERYRSPGNYGFSDWPQRDDLAELVEAKVLEPVANPFDRRDIEVFRLNELPEPSGAAQSN